jgi:hypothetical protein
MEDPSTRQSRLRRCYVNHDRGVAHERRHHYYFVDDCVYPSTYFRQRYCMRMSLFLCIMHKSSETFPHFTKNLDASCCSGLTSLQKCIVTMWLLTYGMTTDMIDEYLKFEKTTTLECLEKYYECIIDSYMTEFLH